MSGGVTRNREARPARDEGFTLIELLVSIGIFGLLMAMVSVFVIQGVGAIKDASTANNVQAQEQNAMLVISRQVRYIDNPVNSGNPPAAILEATPSTLAFFTLSGTGNVDRLPYKVLLCTTNRGVESFSWPPALTNGGAILDTTPDMTIPTCDDAGGVGANRRILISDDASTAPAMSFRYWRARTSADPVGTGDVELVPTGSLTAAQLDLLTKITVTLSDPSLGTPLEQTVVLVNER
jgi:prepilin-type N-terminal cleavage/methylation domain-containing protein